MTWIFFALLSYFCSALSQILDKFLLSEKRIPEPGVYAFYVALFSLFSFVFSPFGMSWLPVWLTGLFLLSGTLFTFGLLTFYYALRDAEVSRIAPLVGLVTTITVILFGVLFPELFGESAWQKETLLALGLFVLGGLLISYDLPIQKNEHIPWMTLLSGVSLGSSLLLLKYGYHFTDFVNGLVWSRTGAFLSGMALLLVPLYRRQILHPLKPRNIKTKKSFTTAALFIFNKSCAGTASFLLLYATAIGSVSFIQALNGMQYVFLLLLSIPFALRFPDIFQEKLSLWDWVQKVVALVIIAVAFFVAGISGISLS